MLVFVASAAAEEPKGLDGLPWGSSPAKIREVLKTHGSLAGSEQDGVEVCEGSSLGDLIGKLTLVNVPSGVLGMAHDHRVAHQARLLRRRRDTGGGVVPE